MSDLHDKYTELGKICSEAEWLDLCVCFGVHACLPGIHDESKKMALHKWVAGSLVLAERSFSEKIDLLHVLGSVVIQGVEPKDKAKFDTLIRRTHNARELRNRRIHAVMSEEGSMRKQFGLRRTDKEGPLGDVEPVTVSVLKQDVEQIRSILRDLSKFLIDRGLWLLPYLGKEPE